jgi:hypothetical protein
MDLLLNLLKIQAAIIPAGIPNKPLLNITNALQIPMNTSRVSIGIPKHLIGLSNVLEIM